MKKKESVSKMEKPDADGDRMKMLSALWGKCRTRRLNEVVSPSYCGTLTVRELAAIVLCDRLHFQKGLDTPISIGDFEGNFSTNVLSIGTAGEETHVAIMGDPNGPDQI